MFCDFCGKVLDEQEIIQARHLSQAQFASQQKCCCDKACDVERRKRDGEYKKMSISGRDARSAAVSQSNHEKPRRKREENFEF